MRSSLLKTFLLPLVLALFPACGLTQPAQKDRKVAAMVNGQTVYEDELMPRMGADLQRLRNQEHQLKQRALQSFVLEKLWRAEAEKHGLTPEKYLEQEVDAKVADPSDADVAGQYQLQKDQWGKPLSEVKDQVRDALKQARIRQARREFFQRLWDSAGVEVLLEPPRVEVAHDPARVRGNPNAPVMIVEFSDFQCPFCRRVQPTLMALLKRYEGKIAISYRDYPLSDLHSQAQMAAETARCAGEQGKFWEYHDRLFSQAAMERDTLYSYGQTLGLDMQRFHACVDSGKYRAAVESDFEAAQQVGVAGTPAFFINGIFLDGAQPQGEFEKIIDAELASLKKK
jgi:predicted DsbA family dithiol-disulfide isomerase